MSVSRGRAFTTKAAAEYVGLAEQTVRDLQSAGRFPKAHKNGRTNVWFVDELDAYLRGNVTGYDEVNRVETERAA